MKLRDIVLSATIGLALAGCTASSQLKENPNPVVYKGNFSNVAGSRYLAERVMQYDKTPMKLVIEGEEDSVNVHEFYDSLEVIAAEFYDVNNNGQIDEEDGLHLTEIKSVNPYLKYIATYIDVGVDGNVEAVSIIGDRGDVDSERIVRGRTKEEIDMINEEYGILIFKVIGSLEFK